MLVLKNDFAVVLHGFSMDFIVDMAEWIGEHRYQFPCQSLRLCLSLPGREFMSGSGMTIDADLASLRAGNIRGVAHEAADREAHLLHGPSGE